MAVNVTAALNISANVSGANQVQNLSNTVNQSAAASTNAQIAGQRLINTLQQQIDTFGKTREQLALMRADQLGVTNQVGPLIQQLQALRDAQEQGGSAASHLSLGTAGARRELIVLAHELSQGNYSRFGGSMMVLAERMDVLPLIFSATGAAVGVVVAALGGLAYAMIKGHEGATQLAHDIQLTGNYAGVTAGEVGTMAKSLAAATDTGIVAARQALDAMIATGRISGPVLMDIGNAAISMSKLTGQSADDIIKDMSKMADGVVKWATEHNKQYHFMDLALYDHIKALEDTGHEQEAMRLVAQALGKQMGQELPKDLGYLGEAWKTVKEWARKAWDEMEGLGRKKTVEDNINEIQKRISRQQTAQNWLGMVGIHLPSMQTSIDNEQEQIRMLRRDQTADETKKQAEADKKAADARRVAARESIDDLMTQADKQRALNKELAEYRRHVADLKGTADYPSASDQAKAEKYIRDKYKEKKAPANKLDNAYKSEYDRLGGQAADIRDQITQWEEYGRAVDKSTLAQLNFQLASGRLKGLSAGQVATLRSMAGEVDGLNKNLASAKLGAEVDAKIKSLDAETKALKEGKAASQEASVMAEYEKKGLKETAAAHISLAQSVNANKLAHDEYNNAAWQQQQAEAVNGIHDQAEALTQTSLQQKILTENRKIDADVIKQSKTETAAGLQDLIQRAEVLKKAYADAYTAMDQAQNSFTTGAIEGTNQVFDEMRNQAADGKKLVTDSFNGMTSALTTLVTTGKLSFKSLAKSIIDDLAQMEVKALIVLPLVTMLKGATNQIAAMMVPTQAPAPIVDGLSGGRAAGGPVNPGELYQVNENGPELLNVGGKSYLMMGNQPGSVTPNGQGNQGGATVVQHITIDARGADASVDAKIHAAMTQAQNNAVAAVTQSLRNGGSVARLTGMA